MYNFCEKLVYRYHDMFFVAKIELRYMVNPLTCCTETFKRSHDEQRAYQSYIAC